MSGNKSARVFHTKKALDERLAKIAALGDERQHNAKRPHCRDRRAPKPCGKKHACDAGENRSPDETGPRFVWRNLRGKLRAADQPACKECARIRGPDDEE